jgi:UDP-glucose:(heptosyl)LPS alpha-1,3-glucosyltransferase
MKAGLIWRGFPQDGQIENYLTRIGRSLSTAGHTPIVYTAKKSRPGEFGSADIRIVKHTRPRAFANGFAALKSRNECDFLLSIDPVWDCDCYLALKGVHCARLEEWRKRDSRARHWLRHLGGADNELAALEEKAFLSSFAKNVVVGSNMVKEELIRHFDVPPNRISVVYEGITIPVADDGGMRAESRRQLGLVAEDYVIFCGGPGLQEHEYRLAIEGINRTNLSQPVLLVSCRENNWIYPRSSRTRFVGQKLDMARLISAADVFLLPVVYDPFSKIGLEALAAGLPVITTQTNGFSEIIEPGVEGEVLHNHFNGEEIARAIEAWSDPEKRQAIKPRLTALAAKFDPDANLKTALSMLAAG